jgi:squalene monooxygenase
MISIVPDPAVLAYHFFCVALYAIWIMLTQPNGATETSYANGNGHAKEEEPLNTEPGLFQYITLLIKAIRVVGRSHFEFVTYDV